MGQGGGQDQCLKCVDCSDPHNTNGPVAGTPTLDLAWMTPKIAGRVGDSDSDSLYL